MQTFKTKVQNKCVLRTLDRTKITHQLCRTFCNKSTCIAKTLHIGHAMITLIRCTKSRILICILHPIKMSTIYNRAAYTCAMTIHIFCRGMRNNICSPLEWTTVDWCSKCIIYNKWNTICMRHFSKLFNIQNGKRWICNCLTKHSLCVWQKSRHQFFLRCTWIYKGHINSHTFHCHCNQIIRSTINTSR